MANMDYPGPCPSCGAIDNCATEEQKKLGVSQYCKGLEMEVNSWKARIYDILVAFDGSGAKEKDKVKDSVAQLKATIRDLEAAMTQMENECPASMSAVEKSIGDKIQSVRVNYTKALEVMGAGSFGG